MPLQIKQGRQRSFEIFEDDNTVLKITKLRLNPTKTGSIIVDFVIMTGQYAGEEVSDFVDYDPSSRNAWRYQRLRKAAGVPYSKDEPEDIDIERLLLNQAVPASLTKRTYKDKTTGVEKTVQQIDYLDKEIETSEEELEDIQKGFDEKETAQALPFGNKEASTNVEEDKPKDNGTTETEDWPFK